METIKIKAMTYGLKFNGKLIKCSVHRSHFTNNELGFSIYAREFGSTLPRVQGFSNETDSQTDYFEKDRITLRKGTALYQAWVGELRKKVNMDRARFRKSEAKRRAKWEARRAA